MNFEPDYKHLQKAARNVYSERMPIYDHVISNKIIGEIINNPHFQDMFWGDKADISGYFQIYNNFLRDMGYDVVIFELCVTSVLPDGGALGGHKEGAIKNRQDFANYPWDEVQEIYFQTFDKYFYALSKEMPLGMKAVGGVGNGVFEIVQDLTGYMDLCVIMYEDPQLFADLFKKAGYMLYNIWNEFLKKHDDTFCVLRFGDDLGFNTQTLLSPPTIRNHIIPVYQKIISLVHSYNKPFLLHSCGSIFEVMEDIITVAGIDAKHSNEDNIAPFTKWIDLYGDKIGNFGGIDTDIICSHDEKMIREYVTEIYQKSVGRGGIAMGTGNSVPDYVSVAGYQAMNKTIRELRGDLSFKR